jgi:hypothetical protein
MQTRAPLARNADSRTSMGTDGAEPIDPGMHFPSTLCFSSGQCFGFFNEM